MSPVAEPLTRTSANSAFKAIFWGGLACGVLDITSALVGYGLRGVKPIRILQSVASGLLGPAAFQGGIRTVVLGTALHFLIAFSAAAVYYVASRKLTFMRERPVLAGLLYGEAVFLFMHFVVIPLSAVPPGPGHGQLLRWKPGRSDTRSSWAYRLRLPPAATPPSP